MAERSEGSCSLSPASSRLCRVSLLLLHAITAKGWHFSIGSRMQQVCSLSAWLEAIGLLLGPMRVLRPAGRDVERHASQYMCGFLSESAWGNNCLEEFRLYLKVHEKSSEQNLAGMCLISGRWYKSHRSSMLLIPRAQKKLTLCLVFPGLSDAIGR